MRPAKIGQLLLSSFFIFAVGCTAPNVQAQGPVVHIPPGIGTAVHKLGCSSFFVSVGRIENKVLSLDRGMAVAVHSHSDRCILLTCKHLIHGAAMVNVSLWSAVQSPSYSGAQENLEAKVIAESPDVDAALLMIETPGGCCVGKIIEAKPEPGASIVLFGQPLEKTGSITRGIVSGYWEIPKEGNLMVSDALLTPGFSGGGVFEEHQPENLVGLITGKTKDQDRGFAYIIPMSRLMPLLNSVPTDQR